MPYTSEETTRMRTALSGAVESGGFDLVLRLNGVHATYAVSNAELVDPPPEREVAARGSETGNDSGGKPSNRTYFTKRPVCRIMCTVQDSSVLEHVTSRMLGPETDFGVVMVDIKPASKPNAVITLLGNVTNSVQTSQLHAVIGIVVVDICDAKTRKTLDYDTLCTYFERG